MVSACKEMAKELTKETVMGGKGKSGCRSVDDKLKSSTAAEGPGRKPLDRKALAARAREAKSKKGSEASPRKYKKRKPMGAKVSRQESYRQDEFLALTGLSKTGLRKAIRQGLETKSVSGKVFITGEAWFRFLEKTEESEAIK